ncbi:MAG TPA: hypothetical protein VF772_00830 [Terriglobales bacterium]
MNHTVGPYDLKLHNPDEWRLPRGLEIPYEECGGQRWRAADVDEAYIGTRRRLEAQCRVQIPIGSGRPSPDGILGRLTIRLLISTRRPMCPRACVSSSLTEVR